MTPRQGSIGGGTVTQGVASLCPGLREVAPLGLKTECAKADQPVLRTSPEEWCCAVSPVTLATRHAYPPLALVLVVARVVVDSQIRQLVDAGSRRLGAPERRHLT